MEPTVTLSLKDFDELRWFQKRYRELLAEINQTFEEKEEYIDKTDESIATLEIDKKRVSEFICNYSEFADYLCIDEVKVIFIDSGKNS